CHATHRYVPAAPLHGGWKSGIQYAALDAARRRPRRRYCVRRFDNIHDIVRWHRVIAEVLEKPRKDANGGKGSTSCLKKRNQLRGNNLCRRTPSAGGDQNVATRT